MEKENENLSVFRVIFLLISLLLMLMTLNGDNKAYFVTLFVFLINKIIDGLSHKNESYKPIFLIIWSMINEWLCILVSPICFCMIQADFSNFSGMVLKIIKSVLFLPAVSYTIQDLTQVVFTSIRENLITEILRTELKERKGNK